MHFNVIKTCKFAKAPFSVSIYSFLQPSRNFLYYANHFKLWILFLLLFLCGVIVVALTFGRSFILLISTLRFNWIARVCVCVCGAYAFATVFCANKKQTQKVKTPSFDPFWQRQQQKQQHQRWDSLPSLLRHTSHSIHTLLGARIIFIFVFVWLISKNEGSIYFRFINSHRCIFHNHNHHITSVFTACWTKLSWAPYQIYYLW